MGLLDDAIREHLDLKRRRGGDPAEIERLEREALGPVRREPTPGMPIPGAFDDRPGAPSGTVTVPEPSGTHADQEPEFEPGRAEAGLPEPHDRADAPREPHPDFHGAVGAPPPVEEPQQPKRRFLRRPSSLSAPPREEKHDDPPTRHEEARDELAPAEQEPAPPHHDPQPPHLTLEGEVHREDEDDRPEPSGRADAPPEEQATQIHRLEPQERRTGETIEFDVREEFHAEDAGRQEDEPPTRRPSGAGGQGHDEVTDRRDTDTEDPDRPEDQAADDDADVLEETPEFLQDTPEHDRLWFEQRPPRDFDFDG